MPPVLLLIAVILSILFIKYKWERRRLEEYINKFEGPPTIPILGNAHKFLGSPSGKYFRFQKYFEYSQSSSAAHKNFKFKFKEPPRMT